MAKKFDCVPMLKALAEESRLRIVRLLLQKERSVNEISDTLGLTQYNVSKHLRMLKEAGLLEVQKSAQQRFYALAEDFRSHLSRNANVLDLGCCTFFFDKLTAEQGTLRQPP